ncbi:TPA: hypothetical protein JAN03_23800 [Citrobacter freundii]|nr:hypothetical protein [Citrobacter freundii]
MRIKNYQRVVQVSNRPQQAENLPRNHIPEKTSHVVKSVGYFYSRTGVFIHTTKNAEKQSILHEKNVQNAGEIMAILNMSESTP